MDMKTYKNAESWEMNKKAGELLARDLRLYHGEPKDVVQTQPKEMSYEEAKKAGNVQAMLHARLNEYGNKRRNLLAYSRELYDKKPIKEIQSSIKELEVAVSTCTETAQLLKEAQERRYRKELSKIGGLVGIHLDGALADAMREWVKTDEKYLQAVDELNAVKRDYTAHCNAKDMYIEANMDLIRAEEEKARHKTLLASGILEEMGIIKDIPEDPEE